MSLLDAARGAVAQARLAPLEALRPRGPFHALKAFKPFARSVLLAALPTPAPVRWAYRAADGVVSATRSVLRRAVMFLWAEPVFRSRAVRVGRRLRLGASPRILGPVRVEIGDDVSISGPMGVVSPRGANARLVIGDRAFVGHGTSFHVARSVEIGEGAGIGARCYVADNDTHPRDLAARLRGEPVPPEEIRPVVIGRNAWVGRESLVMKGVTIGEGAIIGAGSVVVSDVPAGCLAMGNPARVVARL